MRRPSRLITSVVSAVLAGALACAPTAGAAPPPPMTVSVHSPSGAVESYFRVSGQPGQTTPAGTIELRNTAAKPVTVRLDPVGALTASTLGSAYKLRSSARDGAARWVQISQRTVVLGPRGKAEIPVSVTVPSPAQAGDYLAGIAVQAVEPPNVEQGGNVAIASVDRYAIGLFVSLPGPRHPHISLTGVKLTREPAGVTIYVLGRNDGNVILQDVRGRAEITSGDGKVTERPLGPGTFVTDTSIAYPLLLSSEQPQEGDVYRANAYLRYDGGVARIKKQVTFGQIAAKRQEAYGGPAAGGGGHRLLKALAILLVLAACVAALWLYWRRFAKTAARRALEGAIVDARVTGRPLSVISVLPDNGAGSRKLASTVRHCLRRSDRLFSPRGSGLLVLAPNTAPETADTLAAEIRRRLADGTAPATVMPIHHAADSTPEELLDGLEASAQPAVAPKGTGNGAGNHNGNGAGRSDGGATPAQSHVSSGGKQAPVAGGHDGTRTSA
jgi:hypothetical protein